MRTFLEQIVALGALTGIVLWISCDMSHVELTHAGNSTNLSHDLISGKQQEDLINADGKTVDSRIRCPDGFIRPAAERNSFAEYLRKLPLKPHDTLFARK